MKKGLALFIASIVISGFVFAEELDDQIQRLEKETKLLELQKKEQKLQVYKEGTNTNVNSSSKNGIFIGIEGNLGRNTYDIDFFSSNITNKITEDSTTFDLGLMGGYQHYFGSSQRHGIRASAHIYSGFGNSWDWLEIPVGWLPLSIKYNVSYIPIKFGFDVSYLWDFLERNGHVVGLNAGLTTQFDWYFNGIMMVSSDHPNQKLHYIFAHGISTTIGLHYYYKHHQFEVVYKLDEIIGKAKDVLHYYGVKYVEDSSFYAKQTVTSSPYLTFSYAYRF